MVPQFLQPFLPSSLVDGLDPVRDHCYIIENLLRKANLQSWQWMLKTYDHADITEVIFTSRHLKPKDVMFWSYYYQLPLDQILCLQPKSPSIPKSSWAY